MKQEIPTVKADRDNKNLRSFSFGVVQISDPKCYDKYLVSKGYIKQKQPKHENGTKYEAHEFCNYLNAQLNIKGDVVAHVGGHHITTFVNEGTEVEPNYKIYDIWDCSTKTVGNWWAKVVTFTNT